MKEITYIDQAFLCHFTTGEQIRNLRDSLELTQEEFANILDVTKLTVARWETGTRECKGSAMVLMNVLTKYDLWKDFITKD